MRNRRTNEFLWWLLGIAIGCAVPAFVVWWTTHNWFAVFAVALLLLLFMLVILPAALAARARRKQKSAPGDHGVAFDALDSCADGISTWLKLLS